MVESILYSTYQTITLVYNLLYLGGMLVYGIRHKWDFETKRTMNEAWPKLLGYKGG